MFDWLKSSHSDGLQCVEVSSHDDPDVVLLRDTEFANHHIATRRDSFKAFVLGIKDGEFDDIAGL